MDEYGIKDDFDKQIAKLNIAEGRDYVKNESSSREPVHVDISPPTSGLLRPARRLQLHCYGNCLEEGQV